MPVLFRIFSATLLATTAIEPDCDLEQMRAWIERFKEDEEEEVTKTSYYVSLLLSGHFVTLRLSNKAAALVSCRQTY